jgi:hypothetical protein
LVAPLTTRITDLANWRPEGDAALYESACSANRYLEFTATDFSLCSKNKKFLSEVWIYGIGKRNIEVVAGSSRHGI